MVCESSWEGCDPEQPLVYQELSLTSTPIQRPSRLCLSPALQEVGNRLDLHDRIRETPLRADYCRIETLLDTVNQCFQLVIGCHCEYT